MVRVIASALVVVGLVCLILCFVDMKTGIVSMFTSHSSVDKREYPVVMNHENYDDAADMLARLNRANVSVIKHMKKKYRGTVYEVPVARLARRYNPDVLGEHIPLGPRNTSYVTNKGKKIRYCLRPQSDRGSIHDWNILMFVSLHEITHIMNTTFGHDHDFWTSFKFILVNAVEIGIYKPVDYSRTPVWYCNINVVYNPLYDKSLAATPLD